MKKVHKHEYQFRCKLCEIILIMGRNSQNHIKKDHENFTNLNANYVQKSLQSKEISKSTYKKAMWAISNLNANFVKMFSIQRNLQMHIN